MNYPVNPGIEPIIREYIECRERSLYFGKMKIDAEKEYNKLLIRYNGEEKHYSLDHANQIYKAYCDMISYGDESAVAHERFMASEEKLREIGRILFEATITAEIAMAPPLNGEQQGTRTVRVSWNNGQVMVN